MYEKEAVIMYKFGLCKDFLDKLVNEKIITEEQMKRIARIVLNKLSKTV